MRRLARLLLVLLLTATLCGCGRTDPADSEPPPGVRKNPDRKTGVTSKEKLVPREK